MLQERAAFQLLNLKAKILSRSLYQLMRRVRVDCNRGVGKDVLLGIAKLVSGEARFITKDVHLDAFPRSVA